MQDAASSAASESAASTSTSQSAATTTSQSVAERCVAWYQEHPRASNLSDLVNATLGRLILRTTVLPSAAESSSSRGGGLAVLLRGGAFRGAPSDTLAARVAAQAECARSVERWLLRPFHDRGIRAEVFATIYDSDYCAGRGSASQYDGTALWRPYARWLRAVTIVDGGVAEQLSTATVALHAFLRYCTEHGDTYDAVVLTRYDMRFKSSLLDLLGAGGLQGDVGVRFLWHELGNNWRAAWSPSPSEVARADEKQIGGWQKLTDRMINAAARTFRGMSWRQDTRVPDTLHVFGFNYTTCFMSAVHHEMALGWPPSERSLRDATASAASVLRRGKQTGSLHNRWAYAKGVLDAAKASPGVKLDKLNVSLAPLFPWNHWLHKMLPHISRALQIDQHSHEWRVNRSGTPQLRYLIPEGAWSSNPCSGSSCMLNPLYDFMPRGKWVVDAGICQSPSDFVFDSASSSLCCPSPDYCCPNSVSNCSSPKAILFDASRVPTEALISGMRRHYYSRPGSRGPSTICNVSDWNGGAKQPVCFWAMDQPSVERVRQVWSTAPPAPILEDDDDTHSWKAAGAPLTMPTATRSRTRSSQGSTNTPFCSSVRAEVQP